MHGGPPAEVLRRTFRYVRHMLAWGNGTGSKQFASPRAKHLSGPPLNRAPNFAARRAELNASMTYLFGIATFSQ